jgi:oligoendopeptidase F
MSITPMSGADVALFYRHVETAGLDAGAGPDFLGRWRGVAETLAEEDDRLRVEAYQGASSEGWDRYRAFLEDTWAARQRGEQRLREGLMGSRNALDPLPSQVRFQAERYREENVPLLLEERLVQLDYMRMLADQTATWRGQRVPLPVVESAREEGDRRTRERGWRLAGERRLADEPALREVWGRLLCTRSSVAENAGFQDYLSYIQAEDGSPFQLAVEEFVSPPLVWLHEARKERLGLRRLRPWDLQVDGEEGPPGPVLPDTTRLAALACGLVSHVDPDLAAWVERAGSQGLVDLKARQGKAPGGHMSILRRSNALVLLLDGAGSASDLWRLIYQIGRAGAHLLASGSEPWALDPGTERTAAAGTILQLLCALYLARHVAEKEAARAEQHLLEGCLLRWTDAAMLNAFERWAHGHPEAAADPARCDDQWRDLWLRFLPAVDWTGLDSMVCADWQRRLKIFTHPGASMALGVGQLQGVQLAAQVWQGEIQPAEAWRRALIEERLAWDEHGIREAVQSMEERISRIADAS